MQISPDLMRFLLLVCMLSMVILAVFYLRQRKLTHLAYAFLGTGSNLDPGHWPIYRDLDETWRASQFNLNINSQSRLRETISPEKLK